LEQDSREIVERLIAYWRNDPAMSDPAARQECRTIVAGLAASLSAVDLMEFQEEPARHRQRIEASVAAWLATQTPARAVQPPAPVAERGDGRPVSRIVQHNQGETVNSIGEIHTLHTLSFGAPAPKAGRQDTPSRPAAASDAERMVRILFLGANPADSTRLRLDREVREIDQALASAELGHRIELCQKWAVRASDLQGYLLRIKPRILHFSGHGSESAVLLESERGGSRPVEGIRLARLLANFSQRLRCVVLNACYSAEQAEAIAEHIDCVVGMSASVADRAAVRFASSFYMAIAWGYSVQQAFDQACADIEVGELGQDEVPRLVTRRCDPAGLVLVQAD
jgi:hypothetical protein